MKQPPWKLIGLAGVAGVAATGVVVARRRRAHREYDPDELRAKLHRRLDEIGGGANGARAGAPAP
ncbi:MAG: hypothetical protein ACXVFN_14925 [Solirubrobacteraceae bacterium]